MKPSPEGDAVPHAIGDDDTAPTVARRAAGTPPGELAAARPFIVLVADHPAIAARARANCGARGGMLVWVALPATLETLVAGLTPTDVLIDSGSAGRVDPACVRDLEARGVRVRFCRCAHEIFEALEEIS